MLVLDKDGIVYQRKGGLYSKWYQDNCVATWKNMVSLVLTLKQIHMNQFCLNKCRRVKS